jgi:hypothetical protein
LAKEATGPVPTKRFKQAIIHVGTERTGSTSVQRAIFQNRDYLTRNGVFVPMSLVRSYEAAAGVANHILAVLAFADDKMFPTDLLPKDLREQNMSKADTRAHILSRMETEFQSSNSSASTLLISAEHIHSRLDSAESIARMHATLSRFVESFKILAFLRPQVEMAVSLANLALRRGATELRLLPLFDGNGGFDRALGVRRSYFDLNAMLARLSAEFGRQAIVPYLYEADDRFDSSALVFRAAGVALPNSGAARRENASINSEAQEAILFINRNADRIEPTRRAAFLDQVDRILTSRFRGRGIRPSRGEVDSFMNSFGESNEALRAEYFPERDRLFDVRLEDFPAEAQQLSDLPASAVVILELLAEMSRR